MPKISTYLVGGAVRDGLLGVQSKDLDYVVTVEGTLSVESAWSAMKDHLKNEGFTIFLETPEYFTIRAKFPAGHVNSKQTADFVLAREEGPYSDGRRPDWVKPGTLRQDLSRRDFTVNALAMAEDGTVIDLWEGREDLRYGILAAVGEPRDRFLEDALRVFRALRFSITKGFILKADVKCAMRDADVLDKAAEVSADRVRDELHKCFAYDTVGTVKALADYPELLKIAVDMGIWLKPTLEKVK